MFTFTLLTPGGSTAFKASLLVFDNEIQILADPSWNGRNPDDALFMERYLSEIDMILLSHSTPAFIGGYILLCMKFPNLMATIPVYATVAVSQLGRIATVEFYRSNGHLGPVQSAFMEVGDVDEWFDKIHLVKYFQNINALENRLVLTAYNAGHTLGGAFWLVTKRLEKIVYAPTWNHSKDSFLNSASFLSPTTGNPLPSLIRPSALITSTELGSTMSHKKRTEKFLQLVDATLANGGAVLLPTTISGRFLELLHLIDDHLANLQGAAIPVYFLSYSGTKVLSYAANLLDWMSSQLIKEYEGIAAEDRAYSRVPFEPSKVDLLLDPHELIQLPGPKIVFASGLDFRDGDLSSQALQLLCKDEKTTIILTEKSPFANDSTISSGLYNDWYHLASAINGGVPEDGIPVPLEKAIPLSSWTREEPLKDSELAAFKEKISHHRRQKLLAKVRDKKNQNLLKADLNSDDSSSSEDERSSDEDTEEEKLEAEVITTSTVGRQADVNVVLNSHEVFVTDYVLENIDANNPVDIRVTYKLKPRQATFPYSTSTKKRKFDDYGEVIDIKDFQRSDDNSANSKLIMESKRKFEQSDRGKWGENEDFEEGRGGRRPRGAQNGKNSNSNKLTPQEILNNQLLQKSLDTLFKPVKRVSMSVASALASRTVELKVRCGLSFVDLSGIVDMRSLSLIVSLLRPYNLVLLPDFSYGNSFEKEPNGLEIVETAFRQQQIEQQNKSSQESLLASSRFNMLASSKRGLSKAMAGGMKLFVPLENVPAQVGSGGHGKGLSDFEVKLDELLADSLVWQKIDGSYRVTQIQGELALYDPQHTPKKLRTMEKVLNSTTQFLLKQVLSSESIKKHLGSPADGSATAATTGPTLAIGNIRLTELKKKLINRNLHAEFKGEGTLVVNDTIAIRKVSFSNIQGDDTGDIVIDGQIGPLFYEVKHCIREMLAYV